MMNSYLEGMENFIKSAISFLKNYKVTLRKNFLFVIGVALLQHF